MKILTKLNHSNLKQNKIRTLMTIFGVALSVTLILSVIGIVTSFIYTEYRYEADNYGDFDITYRDIPGDKLYIIEESSNYKVQFYANQVGCVERDDETDCYVITPYLKTEYEAIYDKSQIIRDNQHFYNIFLNYADARKAENSNKLVQRELSDAGVENIIYRENRIISILHGKLPATTRIIIFTAATFILGIMIIAAAFSIRNSFNISITERTRQFGVLASIGASPHQIRSLVYREAFLIGLIATPAGILLGSLATLLVINVINNLLSTELNLYLLFYIPPIALLAIIIIAFLIVFLAAASPAIIASRVSPIAALRDTQNTKIKSRKIRTSKLTQKLFGISGVIAAKNLKRSRNKYRTTVVSIVLSVSIFIAASSFIQYLQRIIDIAYPDGGANVELYFYDDDISDTIIKKFNVKKYAHYKSLAPFNQTNSGEVIPTPYIVSETAFREYLQKLHANTEENDAVILYNHYRKFDYDNNIIYGTFDNYKINDQIPYTFIKIDTPETGIIYNAESLDGEYHAPKQTLSKEYNFKISNITDELPYGISDLNITHAGAIFISENNPLIKDLDDFYDHYSLFIGDSSLGESIFDYIESDEVQESDLSFFDSENAKKRTRDLIFIVKLIGYGFVIIVALIGITNVFNTITTNIASRAKEFAILKSIGMSEKDFNHMIRIESLLYITRALMIGLPIGLLLSYFVSYFFDIAALKIGFMIPWSAIFICITSVALLIAIIMNYSVRKIKKQNIIETIRKESF